MNSIKSLILTTVLISVVNADLIESIKGSTSNAIVYTKELSSTTAIKAEIFSIDMELNKVYTAAGKRYMDYASKNLHKDIGLDELLELIKPIVEKKQVLLMQLESIKQKHEQSDKLKDAIKKL